MFYCFKCSPVFGKSQEVRTEIAVVSASGQCRILSKYNSTCCSVSQMILICYVNTDPLQLCSTVAPKMCCVICKHTERQVPALKSYVICCAICSP